MAVYFITGGLGSGKGLAAIQKIHEYANEGKIIAGNIDVYLQNLCTKETSKTTYIRIPDKPTKFDLDCLPSGNDTYDNDNNGLLVLDECLTWLNSRNWQDKTREGVIDWLIHSRKHGYDVMLLVQDFEVIDKQLIGSLMDYHCNMSDLSKINVPIVGRLWKHFNTRGKPLKLPKIHTCNVMYKNIVKADRWMFRAKSHYNSYDTKQVFTSNYPNGTHTQLSRWHLEGRYNPIKTKTNHILPKIIFYYATALAMLITGYNKKTAYQILSQPYKQSLFYAARHASKNFANSTIELCENKYQNS